MRPSGARFGGGTPSLLMKQILDYIDRTEQPSRVTEDRGTLLHLPHPFVSPNPELFGDNQFYWDTYFTIRGLLHRDQFALAKGMVENLGYQLERFGFIPMRNEMYNTGISQPPFFSAMIREIHQVSGDRDWLRQQVPLAEQELNRYWKNERHQVREPLSRYCDHFITNDTSEHESGWDMTSRFRGRALHILPIDLNCLLFQYEKDLESFHTELGNEEKARHYREAADTRRTALLSLLWDEDTGFFHDYDTEREARVPFHSLAAYFALWSGVASAEQARRLVDHLGSFRQPGGLANTQDHDLFTPFRQWDYPNGWPNLQLIVVDGLRRYGFTAEARDIVDAWQSMVEEVFASTQLLWEKYDVVARAPGKSGRYPTQSGFGWTNAVYRIFRDYQESHRA
mgnify:FL=1